MNERDGNRRASFFRKLVLAAVAASPALGAGCFDDGQATYGVPDFEQEADAGDGESSEDAAAEDVAPAEDATADALPEGTWDYGVPDGR